MLSSRGLSQLRDILEEKDKKNLTEMWMQVIQE